MIPLNTFLIANLFLGFDCMRVIYYFLKAISSIVVPIHRSLIFIRFLGINSFSTINQSQRINLDIPSLKKQLPESAISFYDSYKSPLLKIYSCPKLVFLYWE